MDESFLTTPRHAVAVVGGACSGAEAAEMFGKAGIYTVVFEQNARPFGKIEDGLPRWHARQRSQEYVRIGGKLTTPGVTYVPSTAIGRDLSFEDLRSWGFSAVVLACGAWRDRPVRVEGAEEAEGNGLIYQNPFIYWFNHHFEESYDGPQYDIEDGALVIGGGLASIDVVKAVMLETVAEKLRERGHEVDIVHMEHKGIARTLAALELTLDDLGVKGCTLLYRRSAREMPLASFKPGADEASKEKTMSVREKLMNLTQSKYLCNFQPNVVTKRIVLEDGKVSGLEVIRTRTEGRKVIELEGTEHVIPTTQIYSSIGSIPEPIPGLPMKGEYYVYDDWDLGRVKDMSDVFGVGNVVTGQGNIAVSRRHAKKVSDVVVREYLGLGDEPLDRPEGVFGGAEADGAETAERVKEHLAAQPKLPVEKLAEIAGKVTARQSAVDYGGDFAAWIEKVTPPDRV